MPRAHMESPAYKPYTSSRGKLRAVTPEEAESWSSDSSEATLYEPNPLESLDEARAYTFQPGDRVWIRTTEGNWYPGRVNGQTTRKGPTRKNIDGLFYPVLFFNGKVRKYFAPLLGEIKPDTQNVRRLLKEEGWLDSDGDFSS